MPETRPELPDAEKLGACIVERLRKMSLYDADRTLDDVARVCRLVSVTGLGSNELAQAAQASDAAMALAAQLTAVPTFAAFYAIETARHCLWQVRYPAQVGAALDAVLRVLIEHRDDGRDGSNLN